MMSPLVRRSWSPQGQTPVLHQRTRSYKKVSAIAALCISPCRDRVHLYFRLHSDASIDKQRVVEFLRILLRPLDGPTVLVWDRLRAHRARLAANFERRLAPKAPWKADKMTPEVLARMLRQIVPVEMTVETIDSTFKLNQNGPASSRLGAAAALAAGGTPGMETQALAALMREAGGWE